MSIGLYDADMAEYTHVPFNLELMKLAQYYKRKREIVVLSPAFSPERHSTFIYRKDYYDGIFPPHLTRTSNVQYGGLAFTNNKHIPLPLEIEQCAPDTSIYEKYRKQFGSSFPYKKSFNVLEKAEHLRLSLDGQNIWENYEKQLKDSTAKVLFFHDYNLNNIENSYEEIKRLATRDTTRAEKVIGFKFPIIANNDEELLKWNSFKKTNHFSTLGYNGVVSDETFFTYIMNSSQSAAAQFEYYITRNNLTEFEVLNCLPNLYRQLTFARFHHKRVSLKYDTNFFTDKTWEKVIDLINIYHGSLFHFNNSIFEKKKKYETMYNFAYMYNEHPLFPNMKFTKREMRELFQFVRERDYELFTLFYECAMVQLKGGVFVNERLRN